MDSSKKLPMPPPPALPPHDAAVDPPTVTPNAQTKAKPKGKPRKRKRSSRIVLIVALVALVAVIVALSMGGGEEEGIEVEVTTSERRTIVETVTASGIVDPKTQVVISSEVSGEIVFLGVEEGDRVSKGQVLVRINPQSMMAEREQASAQILAARSSASSTKATLVRAEADLARVEKLVERKLATPQELDAARAQVDIAKAETEAATFRIQQAEAALRQVQESLNKTTIVAPISGVVSRLNVKQGEKVVGAIQMTGTELMTIADLSVMEAVVDVVETEVVGIDIGEEAIIEVDAFPNTTFKGIVSAIANSPKTSSMTSQSQLTNFTVHIRILDPDMRFRPGMTATATITTQRKENVVAVPIQAVTTARDEDEELDEENVVDLRDKPVDSRQVETIVYIVDGDSVIQRVVTTGLRDDQFIEVTEGLGVDETIVSGSYRVITKELEQGSRIRRKGGEGTEEEGSDVDERNEEPAGAGTDDTTD